MLNVSHYSSTVLSICRSFPIFIAYITILPPHVSYVYIPYAEPGAAEFILVLSKKYSLSK